MTQEQFEAADKKCREYIQLSREKDRILSEIKDKKDAIKKSDKSISIKLEINLLTEQFNNRYSELIISKDFFKIIMEESIKEDQQRIKEIGYKMSLI